jgi:uncharacterized membrane protein
MLSMHGMDSRLRGNDGKNKNQGETTMGKLARLPAIDMPRGFVIALMALDHARDFFGITPFNPEDRASTTPAWFWTRWITRLCATVALAAALLILPHNAFDAWKTGGLL